MAAGDRLSELMETIQNVGDRKSGSSNPLNNSSLWTPSREMNRGGAPTSDSVGQRGDEGGGASYYMNMGHNFKGMQVEMVTSRNYDGYDGSARPQQIEGLYDQGMMLKLFAAGNGAV
jgi:hypothetical protein